MTTSEQKVAAKVAAVNKANEAANKLARVLRERFAGLVGQQVCKVNGSLLAKFAALGEGLLPDDRWLQVYRYHGLLNSRLGWAVKAVVLENPNGCGGAQYHEDVVTVGWFAPNTHVLAKLEPWTDLRTDWTVAEVLERRAALDEAERAVSAARFAVEPFGKYDN